MWWNYKWAWHSIFSIISYGGDSSMYFNILVSNQPFYDEKTSAGFMTIEMFKQKVFVKMYLLYVR